VWSISSIRSTAVQRRSTADATHRYVGLMLELLRNDEEPKCPGGRCGRLCLGEGAVWMAATTPHGQRRYIKRKPAWTPTPKAKRDPGSSDCTVHTKESLYLGNASTPPSTPLVYDSTLDSGADPRCQPWCVRRLMAFRYGYSGRAEQQSRRASTRLPTMTKPPATEVIFYKDSSCSPSPTDRHSLSSLDGGTPARRCWLVGESGAHFQNRRRE
jgi:hypothetical protein